MTNSFTNPQLGESECRASTQLAPLMLTAEREAQFHEKADLLSMEERVILVQLACCPISGITTPELLEQIGPDIGTHPTASSMQAVLEQLTDQEWIHRGYPYWAEPGGLQYFVLSARGDHWVMPADIRIFCLEFLDRAELEEIEALMEKGVLPRHLIVTEGTHLTATAVRPQ